MARLRRFGGQSAAYTAGYAVAAAINFALIPLLATTWSPSDFGVFGLLQGVVFLLAATLTLNAHISVQPDFGSRGATGMAEIFVATERILGFTVAVGLIAAGVVVAGGLFEIPGWAIVALVAAGAGFGLTQLGSSILVMLRDPRTFLLLESIVPVISATIAIVAVFGFGLGWEGRYIGLVIATVLGGVAALRIMRRRLPSAKPDRIGETARTGAALVPHTTGLWIGQYLDRYIVAAWLGSGPAGLYVIAYSLSLALDALHTGISRAFAPGSYTRLRGGDRQEVARVARAFYLYAVAAIALGLALWIPSQFAVELVLGKGFEEVSDLLPWLLIAQSFSGIARLGSNYLYAASRMALRAALTTATVTVGVLLTIAGIAIADLEGAAVATMITFILSALATTVAAVRTGLLPTPLEVLR